MDGFQRDRFDWVKRRAVQANAFECSLSVDDVVRGFKQPKDPKEDRSQRESIGSSAASVFHYNLTRLIDRDTTKTGVRSNTVDPLSKKDQISPRSSKSLAMHLERNPFAFAALPSCICSFRKERTPVEAARPPAICQGRLGLHLTWCPLKAFRDRPFQNRLWSWSASPGFSCGGGRPPSDVARLPFPRRFGP